MAVLRWVFRGLAASVVATIIGFIIWAWPALYVPAIRDFTLSTVEPVRASDLRRCDVQGLGCLSSLPYDEYLRIRVSSDRNLVDFAAAHELNIWTQVWSCHLEPDSYAMGEFIAPAPYVDAERLPFHSRREVARFYAAIEQAPGSRLDYDIYLVPRWDRTSNAYEGTMGRAPPYDIADGRDVCLRLRGGNMLGGHFVGNTVRVSSAQIRAALARR